VRSGVAYANSPPRIYSLCSRLLATGGVWRFSIWDRTRAYLRRITSVAYVRPRPPRVTCSCTNRAYLHYETARSNYTGEGNESCRILPRLDRGAGEGGHLAQHPAGAHERVHRRQRV